MNPTIPAAPETESQARRFTIWLIALVAVTLVAFGLVKWFGEKPRSECSEIDNSRWQGVIFTKPAVRNKPMLFCTCLSDAARRTSATWLEVALFVAAIGALCALFGGALGPAPDAQPGTLRAQRGILLTGVGALLVTFATYCNARSTVASTAAADAHLALTLTNEKEMFDVCIRAKSFWISSRSESAAGLFSQFRPTPVPQRDGNSTVPPASLRSPTPTRTPPGTSQ